MATGGFEGEGDGAASGAGENRECEDNGDDDFAHGG
jgi:hypothetical protein